MAVQESGPRGDEGSYAPNYLMAAFRRPVGAGTFGVQTMWSLEPAMGPEGYPLLLQVGETADGVNALVDRQHPHDLPMELAVTYARQVDVDRAFHLYVAAVGAPALGPPPFMHRPSGSVLPVSPITHHWFDSTHVTYGVITGGFLVSPTAKIEGSVFRGREPDQSRWGFERPRLDSYAVRLSVNPTPSVAIQVSTGLLNDAEQVHPGADVSRTTASAMYARQWGNTALDAMVAWGRNKRTTTTVPVPGGFYSYPGIVAHAFLAEATMRRGRHAVVTRAERARKDELYPLLDPRHSTLFPVSRLTVAYAFRIVDTGSLDAHLGAAGAWSQVDRALESDYEGDPRSALVFVRLALH